MVGSHRHVFEIFIAVLGISAAIWGGGWLEHAGPRKAGVISAVCWGGGFATIPAYLADIFGTQMVGAIHGRLITSWSVAGVVGPALVAGIRQFQINHGVAHALVYDITLYLMAFLLFCGLVCNFFIKPVHDQHWMSDEELSRERSLQHEDRLAADVETAARGRFGIGGALAWLALGIPFFIGFYIAIEKAAALF